MSRKDRQKEKDYEELFGDGSAELSDVADFLSDFDEEFSDNERPVTNQTLKKKSQTYRERSSSPVPSPSPYRQDERSTPEGDRDEDEELYSKMMVEKLFDELMPKKKGRSKSKGIDIEKEYDATADRLYRRMMKLADDDVNNCQNRKPASRKLDNLEIVVRELSKTYMLDALLENNILDAIRYWLEPLPDRSLPSITLQEQLLTVLDKYPINIDHLLTSKIGRIVFFYQESPRSTEHIKKMATNLVNKWGQPILGISVNYKDRQLPRVEYDPEQMRVPMHHNSMESTEDRQPLQSTSSLVRARIPQPAAFDYDVLPQSRIQIGQGTSLTYNVAAHERACFYAWADKPGEKVAFYFAVQSGGSFDIDYVVTDPRGKAVISGERERQGDFVFTANFVGEYSFCFANDMSTFAEKLVDFEITIENEPRAELPPSKGITPDQTSSMEESCLRLSSSLSTISRTQKYFRTRENRNFSTVKSTENRILWFALLESAVIVTMAAIQVFTVKSFFTTTKRGHV
ncbi:3900_t:CDS:2 [Dentiscutata erythropus]|uniref:3900_t:CDS:1 n=1 Tax=Dentiscutata erythropus TaxID=1348616 RepID=A0A9N9IHR5_9GLOM|nr:3900_t:CDS:2 [Dentiscutata erythropus]